MNSFTQTKRSEVDIRVAQELKNHQDFVHTTNQKLQFLEQEILTLRKEKDQLKNKIESDHKWLEIVFENLKDAVNRTHKSFEEKLDRFRFVMDVHEAFLRDRVSDLEDKYCERDELVHEMKCRSICDVEMKDSIDKLEKFVASSLLIFQRDLEGGIELLRKDLTPVVPEIDPLEQKVNQILSEWKVDQQGLVKEIAILKKASNYADKKFENIYTLIERLKEGSA